MRRNNKVIQAANLPKLVNLNARSIYNKIEEFHLLVEQYEADAAFVTETWEREQLTLNDIMHFDTHEVFTNIVQREGVGGKAALIINTEKYYVKHFKKLKIFLIFDTEMFGNKIF